MWTVLFWVSQRGGFLHSLSLQHIAVRFFLCSATAKEMLQKLSLSGIGAVDSHRGC